MKIEEVLRKISMDADAFYVSAEMCTDSLSYAKNKAFADGMRRAVLEIEYGIKREKDRIVETAPVTLTKWPKEVPEGRWVYHTIIKMPHGPDFREELLGEFQRVCDGLIYFDDGRTVYGRAEFVPGEKFVKVEAGE